MSVKFEQFKYQISIAGKLRLLHRSRLILSYLINQKGTVSIDKLEIKSGVAAGND